MTSVGEVVAFLERRYPPGWAESWDRVGLVLGEPAAPVRTALLVVDCVPETVDEAVALGADLIVAHHPLLLRGVSSVAPTTYKGHCSNRVQNGTHLRARGVDLQPHLALLGDRSLVQATVDRVRPLVPAVDDASRGTGRIGVLPSPVALAELAALAARVLPATAWGVRAAGDPERRIGTVAVCGGSGDAFLADAARAGVDAYLTADLRHHPVSEYLADGGPALVDAAHWATEHPWLDELAAELTAGLGLRAVVSDVDTDPWTLHYPTNDQKEPSP